MSEQYARHSSSPRQPPGPPLCFHFLVNRFEFFYPLKLLRGERLFSLRTRNIRFCARGHYRTLHTLFRGSRLAPPCSAALTNFCACSNSSSPINPCSRANWRHSRSCPGALQYVSHSRPRHPPGPSRIHCFLNFSASADS